MAIPRPMPTAPPVTRAFFPLRSSTGGTTRGRPRRHRALGAALVLHARGSLVVVAEVLQAPFPLDAGHWPVFVVALDREHVLLGQRVDGYPRAKCLLYRVELADLQVDVKYLLLQVQGRARDAMPPAGLR